jgi:5-methylthioadenosine/S-adenosylhomocysteine deaminase
MTEEDSYIATLLHILTSIRMGITCFVETGSYFPDVMGKAVVETGIRCVLSRLTMDTKGDLPHSDQGILPDETTEQGLERSNEFVERWHGQADGRIRAWLSMHMLQICSDKLYSGAKELADKFGVGVQTHLCSVRAETDYSLLRWGRRPIEHLDDLGVLGPNFLIHHGVLVSDSDIRLLAERGVGVVHCPNSVVMAKQGIPRIPQMIDAGVTVALAGDGYFCDQIELMKFAEAYLISHWAERYNDPNVLLPETLLEMATLNGAKVVSWDDEIGSIQAGKKADLITMKVGGQVHQTPHWDLLAELVHHSYSSDIETVIVDGKILMEDRKVLVLDEEEILRKGQEHAERVFRDGNERGLIRKFQKLERWPFE